MNLFKYPVTYPVLYLLVRMALSMFSPVPSAVALDPLWAVAALLHGRAGRVWVFALLPGMVLGDWMAGISWQSQLLRSVGFLLLAVQIPEGSYHRQCVVWAVIHGLFSSLMPDWQGWFPFGYVYAVWLLQGILWWGLLMPPEPTERGSCPVWPLFFLPVLVGLLYLIMDAPAFWPLPRLGSDSGLVLKILGTVLLVPAVAWLFLPMRKTEKNSLHNTGRGRWTHLAE